MKAAAASAVGLLAAPVTVLTVCHDGRVHGTTVSALTTVSRTPLLLTASLREGSDLAQLALAEGRFAVNVLSGGQRAVARRFADRDRPAGAAQFEGFAWRTDRYSGAPLLDGALAHYACRVRGSFLVGDHEVLLGLVVRADAGLSGLPLLSYDGELLAGGADADLSCVPDFPIIHPKETATL
ncbi:flavin reductase family protein [Streptomyces viridochromogenes]|uniref:flavin reductase family protein n=1 Tax=Streptomyces viridochromogenes TaxID=1938 RepID=UPI00069D71A2|nr:flavin reductase family protein [Streptomyces viridochromogenes]